MSESASTSTGQILPGQELDGGIVVASVYINDTDYDKPLVMALLLMPEPGRHYRLVDVWENCRCIAMRMEFKNIVPAVAEYVERGGDY